MTEDEMVGWHQQLNGHEFEQTIGDSEGQGGLVCCSPWGRRESAATQRLNSNNSEPETDSQRTNLWLYQGEADQGKDELGVRGQWTQNVTYRMDKQ